MHTALFDVPSETAKMQHRVWLCVFHCSNPKSQSKTPGHKPTEMEKEGNVHSHPLEAELHSQSTEPGGEGALRFVLLNL